MSGLGAKFEESLQMQPGNWPASKKIVFNGQIGHEKYAYCFQKHLFFFCQVYLFSFQMMLVTDVLYHD